MKDFLEKIKDLNNTKYGHIGIFFIFYLIFFVVLFLVIRVGGNENYLNQEYEKGNSSLFDNSGVLGNNYFFNYKVILDGEVFDYYGKKYKDTELFKYNNHDYYRRGDNYFINDSTWTKCDNPYKFYEFIDTDKAGRILDSGTFMSKTEYEDGRVDYNYFISTNTINKIFYDKNTDYDENPNSVVIGTDKEKSVNKIVYKLDSFCKLSDLCNDSLTIELKYEMFNEVKKIDSPIE